VRARVAEKREVALGTLFVTFDLDDGGAPDWRPGQYFWVELLDSPYDDERGPRRHITIATSPTEGRLGLATRLRDTAFKRGLAELAVGDAIEVEEPKGTFSLPEDTEPSYVFVAGGIGITVFRSMLHFVADRALPYRVTLLYSNRDRASTAFLDELTELESRIPGLKVVATMTADPDWTGERRRIDERFLRDHLGDELGAFTYIVAGPPGMVDGMKELFGGLGLPEEQLIVQGFAGY
jgi:ferredoxin-NADP reductase